MEKVYAKNCEIQLLNFDDAMIFLEENHTQKSSKTNSQVETIGIYFNNEIIGVAQFCTPRTSKKQREYSTELLRLAFKKDTRVVGGASKLIKYYIKKFNPADIFTYQDATGENTSVYEHAGFSFVSQDKKKEYLVAPGHTLETGNRKEVLGMPYVVQYGPDRILGTKLGEIIDPETGKRKSNKRIFIEDLGWHIETTPGDKIYEWFNQNMTHYVYKITASDSDKYYYGVSHVKKANATIDDCLNDGYYGSGGSKYKNWKKKHHKHLDKEIISIHVKKSDAYDAEKNMIGKNFINDQNCLNVREGGQIPTGAIPHRNTINYQNCNVHGLTKHQGNTCAKCTSKNSFSLQNCVTHGTTMHQGSTCAKCKSKSYIIQNCLTHGKSNHVNGVCLKCHSSKQIKIFKCATHGETKHKGNSCIKCINSETLKENVCITHGETIFSGSTCLKCSSSKKFTNESCEIHGETIYRSGKCDKCISDKFITFAHCEVHGITKHNNKTCYKCSTFKTQNKNCLIHGNTKHNGDNCYKCINKNSLSEKECNIHGKTTHKGETCLKCVSGDKTSLKVCPTHGETKHQGDSCARCSIITTVEICEIHGKSKHRGGKCFKCFTVKSIIEKDCSIHGRTKFRGEKCVRCIAQNQVITAVCEIHGETPFQYEKCAKCVMNESINMKDCEIHGFVKHMGDTCATCTSQKSVDLKICKIHGETKYQGDTCMKCNRQTRLSPETRASNEKLDKAIDEIAEMIQSGVLLKDIAAKFEDHPRRIAAAIKRSKYSIDELRDTAKKNS